MTGSDHILLKLTGGVFTGTKAFDNEFVGSLAGKIGYLAKRAPGGVAITVGAGNIFRGRDVEDVPNFPEGRRDPAGMTATIVNGLVLAGWLESLGHQAVVMTAFGTVPGTVPVDHRDAQALMNEGVIVIFVGGTGRTGVTTDTGVVERAVGCGIQTIYMAKDGAHGVYDADPSKVPDANHFSEITISKILDMGLEVMDEAALLLARQEGVGFVVFKGDKVNQWQTVLDPDTSIEHTIVHAD